MKRLLILAVLLVSCDVDECYYIFTEPKAMTCEYILHRNCGTDAVNCSGGKNYDCLTNVSYERVCKEDL